MSETRTQNGATAKPRPASIEHHHIDVVPERDRHGRPRDQFTLWFGTNANVLNFVLGGVVVSFGLNLFWAIMAIALGACLGMILTGLHSLQGPRLGVPQMIQTRAQFGYYGASIIFLASILLDVGYMAAQQVVQARSLHLMVPGVGVPLWILVVTIPAVVLAIVGYDLIHRAQNYLTVIFAVVLVIALVRVLTHHNVLSQYRGFEMHSFPSFLTAVGLFFMNMLSWSIYASDYSRYLPRTYSSRRIFFAVFAGNAGSTTLYGALGVLITTMIPDADPLHAMATVAGLWILPFFALSQVSGDTLNAYTGMLALVTMGSGSKKMMEPRFRRAVRVCGIAIMFVIGTTMAVLGYRSFVTQFQHLIDVLLFLIVPWSAITLADFFLIRRGNYDVQSLFTPRGSYGRWRPVALTCYLIVLAIQVPFIHQDLYTGPAVAILHGTDISWIVGFVCAFFLYYFSARKWGGRQEPPIASHEREATQENPVS